MNQEQLEALREWVKSEVDAGVANSQPGADGYFGGDNSADKESDKLFEVFMKKAMGK